MVDLEQISITRIGSHTKGDIKEAWNYQRDVSLPRKIVKEGTVDDFRKVEPGEAGGTLYPVFGTPLKEVNNKLHRTTVVLILSVLRACMCVLSLPFCIALNMCITTHIYF